MSWTSKVSEVVVGSGLEVTVKEQQKRQEQGRVKHEKGDGEMENDVRMRQTPFTRLNHACVFTRMRSVKCAQRV